jgi:hypothetical protein
VELLEVDQQGQMAKLDAEHTKADQYRITTENVAAFRLVPPLPGSPTGAPTKLSIDGQQLSYGSDEPVTAWRFDGSWHKRTAHRGRRKSAGVEGPIRDVFLGPLSFVYGSLDERTRRANREVAERFGRYHSGLNLDYPVLADRELNEADARNRSLVLVGTAKDNAYLQRIVGQLPIFVEGDALRVGQRTVTGADVGAIFIHPNPEHPTRYVVVITAPSPRGIWRSLSLPMLLPDYLVYDASIADAATEQVLGHAQALAAGFFQANWSLPEPDKPSGVPR